MSTLAKVERRTDGKWHTCRMKELKKSDIFRITEEDGSFRGEQNYIAESEPMIMEIDGENIWGITALPE